MSELNKAHAAIIFDVLMVTVERFHAAVKLHTKAIFLGYANLTINLLIGGQDVGCTMRLRGIQCKILNGNFRLDMPGDKVERNGKTEYIPHFFPLSGELRAVLEAKVSTNELVLAAVEAAAQLAAGAKMETETSEAANPFRA